MKGDLDVVRSVYSTRYFEASLFSAPFAHVSTLRDRCTRSHDSAPLSRDGFAAPE